VLLESGRIVASAAPQEFLRLDHPKSRFRASLDMIRSFRMNPQSDAWTFFAEHRDEIFSATVDHLTLVVIA